MGTHRTLRIAAAHTCVLPGDIAANLQLYQASSQQPARPGPGCCCSQSCRSAATNPRWYATACWSPATAGSRRCKPRCPTGGYTNAGKSSFWAPGGQLVVAAPGTGNLLLLATCEAAVWSGALQPI